MSFHAPPPAAASLAAVKELSNLRHKRSYNVHIVMVPRNMTHLWHKTLFKEADCLFEIPSGSIPTWLEMCYEPIVVTILFARLQSKP